MTEVNFVRQRIKKLTNLEKKDRQLFKIVAIVTAVILVIFMAVLGARIYFTLQLKNISELQQDYRSRVKTFEEREKKFVIFINKLKALGSIFNNRQDKQQAILYFTQAFGPDVTIERMSYDADGETLAFGLRAADVFTLENVFKTLSSEQTTGQFAEVNKSGLARSDNGTYQMKITIVLGKDG